MPRRLERRQNTGNLHYITFSCQDRNAYLRSPDSKTLFQSVLESRRIRYQFDVAGYVVMPEHVHLLITEPPGFPLFIAIASIKREVSRKSRESPFWLPRYYDFNIFTNEKRVEKLRYIHRNPVHRGLVEKPEDYIWSSFRSYALLEDGPVRIARDSG
jgi:putative transposase